MTKQFKKWAFIVGVSTYDDEHFSNLEHATNHVREFKKLLEDSNEFEPIVYLSEEGDKDHKPTSGNIMKQYAKLLKKVRPNDLLIVYILSHGGIFERKKCIFPKNASKESKEILKRESIPLSYFLEEEISNYEPENWKVFFFFDICQCHIDIKSHGDGDAEAAKKVLAEEDKRNEELELEPMEINEEPSGIAQFYACSSHEEAFVFKKEGENYSVFSFALLKALKGGIEGPLQYGRIVKFVKKEIIDMRTKYDNVPFQKPVSLSDESADKTVLIGDKPPFTKEKGVRDFEITLDEDSKMATLIIDSNVNDPILSPLNCDDYTYNLIKANVDELLIAQVHASNFIRYSLGRLLYDILFNNGIKDTFENKLKNVKKDNEFLRIKFKFKASKYNKLRNLPWEYLYCEDLGIFLARDRNVLLSYLYPTEKSFIKHDTPLKILLITPPSDESLYYDIVLEIERLRKDFKDKFDIRKIPESRDKNPTLTELEQEIDKNYAIIHFIGFAKYENDHSQLLLYDDDKNWVKDRVLAHIFKKKEKEISFPHLVIVPIFKQKMLKAKNSVYLNRSNFARKFIEEGFPSVITFQHPIKRSAVMSFCREYYKQIADENRISAAVLAGRFQVNKKKPFSSRDFGTPVLYTQVYDNIIETKKKSPEQSAIGGEAILEDEKKPKKKKDFISDRFGEETPESDEKQKERQIIQDRTKYIESVVKSHRETLHKFDNLLVKGNISDATYKMRVKMIKKELEKLENELEEIKMK